MDHIFSTTWDAPFDKIELRFRFTPGYPATGPSYSSGGEPRAPDDVEVLSATVTVAGKRHEAPDWLTEAFGKLFDGDLVATAREDDAEARSYSRRAA